LREHLVNLHLPNISLQGAAFLTLSLLSHCHSAMIMGSTGK
jgi:hypothetical protein